MESRKSLGLCSVRFFFLGPEDLTQSHRDTEKPKQMQFFSVSDLYVSGLCVVFSNQLGQKLPRGPM
jgi:hypothetical protein